MKTQRIINNKKKTVTIISNQNINFNLKLKEKSIIIQNKNVEKSKLENYVANLNTNLKYISKKDNLIINEQLNPINNKLIHNLNRKLNQELNFDDTFELVGILLKNNSINIDKVCFKNDIISK